MPLDLSSSIFRAGRDADTYVFGTLQTDQRTAVSEFDEVLLKLLNQEQPARATGQPENSRLVVSDVIFSRHKIVFNLSV